MKHHLGFSQPCCSLIHHSHSPFSSIEIVIIRGSFEVRLHSRRRCTTRAFDRDQHRQSWPDIPCIEQQVDACETLDHEVLQRMCSLPAPAELGTSLRGNMEIMSEGYMPCLPDCHCIPLESEARAGSPPIQSDSTCCSG